jgi:murein DD-endopeptidase MepM/ murein hydrolase activator NlpD
VRSLSFLIILITFFAVFLAGCATARPVKSHRHGFFDQFEKEDHRKSPVEDRVSADDGGGESSIAPIPMKLSWPLESVTVTSRFGKRGKEFHEGIDLAAKKGTPVHSAQSGVVIYAGQRIRGYGKLVVIRHVPGLSTVYAHNSKLMVIVGQKVHEGQIIAYSGATGRVTGPHLHFEVRRGTSAVDPSVVLASSPAAAPHRELVASRETRSDYSVGDPRRPASRLAEESQSAAEVRAIARRARKRRSYATEQ